MVAAGNKRLPIPTPQEVAAVANTPRETFQQMTDRECLEDQKRLAAGAALALKRGLIPLKEPCEISAGEYALGYTFIKEYDITLGGKGAAILGLNPQRPMVRIQLHTALDTGRLHSSGIEGEWRQWQVVFLKDPARMLPKGAKIPASARFVVWWIAQVFDENNELVGEPRIYVVPWLRITQATHKCKPFVLECGPQDFRSQEKLVLPFRKRNTNLNGYYGGIFSTYFRLRRLKLVELLFPLVTAPMPSMPAAPTAPAEAAAASAGPHIMTSPDPRPPLKFLNSTTARRSSARVACNWSAEQVKKIETFDAILLRAEAAEAEVIELTRSYAALKLKKTPRSPAEPRTSKAPKRSKPQYLSRAVLEDGLEENYSRTKPK